MGARTCPGTAYAWALALVGWHMSMLLPGYSFFVLMRVALEREAAHVPSRGKPVSPSSQPPARPTTPHPCPHLPSPRSLLTPHLPPPALRAQTGPRGNRLSSASRRTEQNTTGPPTQTMLQRWRQAPRGLDHTGCAAVVLATRPLPAPVRPGKTTSTGDRSAQDENARGKAEKGSAAAAVRLTREVKLRRVPRDNL